MVNKAYEDYNLNLKLNGKLVVDLSKIDIGTEGDAYNRLRQRVSKRMKETGHIFTTRKKGNIVTVYRVE